MLWILRAVCRRVSGLRWSGAARNQRAEWRRQTGPEISFAKWCKEVQVEVEQNLTTIAASSFTYRDHLDRGRPTRPALQQQQPPPSPAAGSFDLESALPRIQWSRTVAQGSHWPYVNHITGTRRYARRTRLPSGPPSRCPSSSIKPGEGGQAVSGTRSAFPFSCSNALVPDSRNKVEGGSFGLRHASRRLRRRSQRAKATHVYNWCCRVRGRVVIFASCN